MILAIDTSCDETAAAVTLLRQGSGRAGQVEVFSNVIWSQASQHAQFGGVMPSLAQRMHRERIDWVVKRAMDNGKLRMENLDAIAVTQGPGLAIALEVGISKAKELAKIHRLPLIPINHIEGHLLSPLAVPFSPHPVPPLSKGREQKGGVVFPALGLVVSGGHTELILIKKIGEYKILAKTQDDALGEALDKAARMLGLGYPGGATLEKMARMGNPKAYPLPLPMARNKDAGYFSYSGLKTAMWRLVEKIQNSNSQMTKQQIYDLAATFQNRAFQHLERVVRSTINSSNTLPCPSPSLGEGIKERGMDLLVGGGVAANMELRKRLRRLGNEMGFRVRFPYSMKLVGDNAAMIGVAAGFKSDKSFDSDQIDRKPRWSIEE